MTQKEHLLVREIPHIFYEGSQEKMAAVLHQEDARNVWFSLDNNCAVWTPFFFSSWENNITLFYSAFFQSNIVTIISMHERDSNNTSSSINHIERDRRRNCVYFGFHLSKYRPYNYGWTWSQSLRELANNSESLAQRSLTLLGARLLLLLLQKINWASHGN